MTERTKILYVITKSSWGGAQRYVYDLATSLPKDKFDVAVVVGSNGRLVDRLNDAKIRVISIESLGRDVYLGKDFKSFRELRKIFKIEKPDVVHLNSSKAGGLGALAARFSHVPRVIFTAHGWAFNEKRPLWQRIILYISYITIIILADKTICVSNAVFRNMHSARGINYKLQVILLSIKKPTYETKEESRKKLLGENTDRKIIGMISELHPTKRIEDSIVAIEKLKLHFPNILLLVAGEGDHRKILEQEITKRSLQNNVKLLGFVEDVSKYTKAFDIFLFPSKTEGLGYALLEAGAAEMPVVASRVGGIPEVITDGASGILITPEHPDEIVDAVIKLSDKDIANKMGSTLAERVRRGFVFDKMMSDTIKTYSR